LRSEARYVKLLDRPHWLVGAGLEWRFPLPEGTAGPALGAGGTAGSGRAAAAGSAAAVHASGTISRISLPMSASGRWEFSADLVRGTASVYLEGTVDGESGAIGFSNATRVSFSGSSVSATFEERDTHEGKPVWAVISLSVSERGFSLSITARRSDGLSASASVSGRTSRFDVVPLPRPAAAGAGEADSTTTDGTEPDITKADRAAADAPWADGSGADGTWADGAEAGAGPPRRRLPARRPTPRRLPARTPPHATGDRPGRCGRAPAQLRSVPARSSGMRPRTGKPRSGPISSGVFTVVSKNSRSSAPATPANSPRNKASAMFSMGRGLTGRVGGT